MHEPPRKSSSLGLPVNIDKSVALAIPVASPPPPPPPPLDIFKLVPVVVVNNRNKKSRFVPAS